MPLDYLTFSNDMWLSFVFKVSTNGKHFSYLFFWPKVIDIEMHLTIYIYAFKLGFRKRFLSHAFLIYANSKYLGKVIKSEQVFSYN